MMNSGMTTGYTENLVPAAFPVVTAITVLENNASEVIPVKTIRKNRK